MTEPTSPAPKRRRSRPEPGADDPGDAAATFAAVEGAAEREACAEAGDAMDAGPADASVAAAGTGFDAVSVERLHLERGGINEATAANVEVRMGGIGRLDAEDVFVQFGGVGVGRADSLNVEWGSVGAAAAGELRVTQGIASNVIAREATVDQALVRTLIAARVTVTRPSAALVVLAAKVDGEVRTLLDWRGALALGVGFGVVASIARALRRGR